jgi:hypothetical protein
MLRKIEDRTNWSVGAWTSVNDYSNKRYRDYHMLDIAFNRMFNFNNWSIAVFLSIQNLYDRKNVAGYLYNSDETKEAVNQYSFLPVLGIDMRF